jgi:uncharacterized protein (TIGR03663 family)
VAFGVLLVLLSIFITTGLGKTASASAAALVAVSPAMVFYSRYYIMEVLLVCFTAGVIYFGYRYVNDRKITWAIAAGVSAGFMQATKETSVIAFGAMFMALVLTHWMHRRDWSSHFRFSSMLRPAHLAAAIGSALAIILLLYSSFFSHWQGIIDAFRTYIIYLGRAGGNSYHLHGPLYYLHLLTFWPERGGWIWSEAVVLFLAVVGGYHAFRGRGNFDFDVHLGRFLVFYTVIVTVIYSVLPYKTPWNLLTFYHGCILLAGIGVAVIIKSFRSSLWPKIAIPLIVAGCFHLLWQVYLASYKFPENPENPYVYAHPLPGVQKIAGYVDAYAAVDEHGKNMRIDVICPVSEVWPLKWYLRAYPNFGFWKEVDNTFPPARLILAVSDFEQDLLHKLYEVPPPGKRHLYLPMFQERYFIRDAIEMSGYVRKDLWDVYQRAGN